MFKESESLIFYRSGPNQDRQAKWRPNTDSQIVKPHTPVKSRMFSSPQHKAQPANHNPSPIGTKLLNKQNHQQLGNFYVKNITALSPRKMQLTPSKMRIVYQNSLEAGNENYQGAVQFRLKSPLKRVEPRNQQIELSQLQSQGQSMETQGRQCDQGFKLLNMKRGSMQLNSPNVFLQDKHQQKKPKAQLLDEIIINCGRKQQQTLIKPNGVFQPKSKGPFLRQNLTAGSAQNPPKRQPFMQQSRVCNIMCQNNHDKLAKYKAIDSDGTGQELIYYCLKCAVCLIQQGFKVQQIQMVPEAKTINNEGLQILSRLANLRTLMVQKKGRTASLKSQHIQLYEGELRYIDAYYGSLSEQLERLRLRDRGFLISHQSQDLKGIDGLISQVQDSLVEIQDARAEIQRKPEMLEIMRDAFQHRIVMLEELQSHPEQVPQKQISVCIKDQAKVRQFGEMFLQDYSLKIDRPSRVASDPSTGYDNLVAFSFDGGPPALKPDSQVTPLHEFRQSPRVPCQTVEVQNQEDQQLLQPREYAEEVCTQNSRHSPSFKKI